jgi:hypothetical protein
MIFSDQETAKEVRTQAQQEMTNWIADMCITIRDGANHIDTDISDVAIQHFVENKIQQMPKLLATLLFKSGMIHQNIASTDETPHYPLVTYYDNDKTHGHDVILAAMTANPHRLIGGMVDGSIHT